MSSDHHQTQQGEDQPPQPRQLPDVATPPYAKVVTDAWVVEGMMQIQHSLGELKSSVAQLQLGAEDQERAVRSDFRWTWTGLAAATVLLIRALIFGYFRLDDRQAAMSTTLTKIDTKVDGILQRDQTPKPPPLPTVLGH